MSYDFLIPVLLVFLLITIMSGFGFLVYWFAYGAKKFFQENMDDPKAKYWRY